MVELRPYQEEARDAVLDAFDRGQKHSLLVLPTGCGKTIVFSSVIAEYQGQGQRTLVLAHTRELLSQAQDKLMAAYGIPSVIEHGKQTILGSGCLTAVSSVQGMRRRLGRFPADYFQLIVVDETHHILSDSYQKVLAWFPDAKVLGVTATPSRADQQSLLQFYTDGVTYEYTLVQAIRDGWLCPIWAERIPLEVDLRKVRVRNGDYEAGDLGRTLEPYLYDIAVRMRKYCPGHRTVAFLPLVDTARKFASVINDVGSDLGLRAVEVDGKDPYREDKLEKFSNGTYNVLCNSMLLTEGWDCPSVDRIVILRPTRSRTLYQQMVGRGTRICEGKDRLLLLDFLYLTDRHDICGPASLISGDEEVVNAAEKKVRDAEEGTDLLAAGEEAGEEVKQAREEAVRKRLEENQHREKETIDLASGKTVSGEERGLVSYQEYAELVRSGPILNFDQNPAGDLPPTAGQISLLKKFKLSTADISSRRLASLLLDSLCSRSRNHMASPKQMRLLYRYGFTRVDEWSAEDAKKMITRMAGNRWKVPRGVDPAEYKPDSLAAWEEWGF